MGLAEFQARCSTGAAEKKGGFRNNPTTKSLYLFQDRAAVDPSKARAELAVHDILLDYLDADEAEFRIQCERHELACMGEMGGKWLTLWGCVLCKSWSAYNICIENSQTCNQFLDRIELLDC